MTTAFHISMLAAAALAGATMAQPALGHDDEDHHGAGDVHTMMEQMRHMHEGHEHSHDFEAIEAMGPEEMGRVMDAMMDIGLAVPPMDAHHGHEIFVQKGCVVCHQVNGVGGEVGPSLDAADMPKPMNAFEFAARMWRGAEAMIALQQDLLGEQITLTGQDLADLVAFAHDEAEQKELTVDEIPEKFHEFIEE